MERSFSRREKHLRKVARGSDEDVEFERPVKPGQKGIDWNPGKVSKSFQGIAWSGGDRIREEG
jgi:hypothetical protein